MTRKKPGHFAASCAVAHDKQAFDDPALFEEHMLVAHDAKPGMAAKREAVKRPAGRFLRYGDIIGWHGRGGSTFKRLKLWRTPRLTAAGRDFAPAGLEPGATVTWRELVKIDGDWKPIERSGQVWCEGWRPRSAWVVPFALRVDEKGHLEQAVMVEQRRKEWPDLEHYSTQWSSITGHPEAVSA